MQRDGEHVRRVVKRLLGAVAVVHVPIHHRHPLDQLPRLGFDYTDSLIDLVQANIEPSSWENAENTIAAIGSFLGSVIGGFLADSIGFNAINWMAAISAALGALVLFFILWPAERKKRKEEAG